jgi:lysophospholipase L1-like esterase
LANAKGTLVNLRTTCTASLISALFCALLFVLPAKAGVLTGDGIGAYGDSLTMQYSSWVPKSTGWGYPLFSNGKQLNWVDHLKSSGYNFGTNTSTVLYGTTVNYARYDAAVAGAASADLASQVTTLQPYIAAHNVKLTVLGIGGNDFTLNGYDTIYNKAADPLFNPLTDPATQTFMDTIVNRITAAVNSTLATDPSQHMILMTVPDLGSMPLVINSHAEASQRADVTAVVSAINQRIINLANSHHMPVVNLQPLTNLLQFPPTVAGVTLLPAGGQGGQNMFLSDGFHPGTVINGLLANAILLANHVAYNDPVTYVSDQTIVTRAGLTPSGPSPTFYNVAPFVIFNPVPEPSSIALAGIAVGISLVAAWRRRGVKSRPQ